MRLFAWVILVALPGALVPAQAHEAGGMYSTYRDEAGSPAFDRVPGDSLPLTADELLPSLLESLNQLSKYPKPARLPAVLRVSRDTLEAVGCAGKKPCGVLAIYRPEAGIYLDERLDPETNLFDRSVLLHELVHYLQDLHGERGDMRPCDRWYHREVEAYAIQKQFLMLVGSPVRVGYSASQSTCAGEDPPPSAASHHPAPR
jgi:hypothetical protein